MRISDCGLTEDEGHAAHRSSNPQSEIRIPQSTGEILFMTRRKVAAGLLLFALLSHAFTVAVTAQTPQPTPDAVERIKDEGVNRSRLLETVEYITDVIGPRLTGSASLRRANEWTRERLTQYGLTGAHLEPWGPFGRGWTLKRFSAEVVAPQ